ncbi:MAG TPA: GNAT family N-acetyltransferase [Thermoanaerobaculia bacterium]
MHEPQYAFADLALSRRLERCEASANAALIEARARLSPQSGAAWIECAGAYAMFDGVGSPLTQTFGLGVFETPKDADLDRIETFFHEREAGVFHEVSPIAPPEVMQLLVTRGYQPVELTSVMHQPLKRSTLPTSEVKTRIATDDESELWAETAAKGWGETPELTAFIRDLGRISADAEGVWSFIAELDGRAVGTGALVMHDGVALLAGASTIPEARNRGAQRALLEARLHYAAEHGCDLAMMCAAPGSTSQRNAERRGFRIAYTRIKWGK